MNHRSERQVLTRRSLLAGMAGVAIASFVGACGGNANPTTAGSVGQDTTLQVVAAENFWGSIASQLGGERVRVTSLITNPNTDPHDYEPKPSEARTIADARFVILNGAGYDPWMQSLIDANPSSSRVILNVGDLVGKKSGDNPHLWYNPDDVSAVIERITHDLSALAPADAAFFAQQHTQFTTGGLKAYHELIATIKQTYSGTPIGSTESIFVYMAAALGLDLTTPIGFMNAISEGNDVTASDKATFDQQVTQKQIKVLVYNTQNATPDTDALKVKATNVGIPIVGITETLDPATDTFEAWQVRQLTDLKNALAQATGR
jgi:zinc/manganese transport system substrate-binding protein